MGDIADMMIDGILDMYTGEYLGDAVGYPRTREHMENTPQSRRNGIFKFLSAKGITKKQRREILLEFYPDTPNKDRLSNEKLCVYASDNFGKFKKHVNERT